MTDEFPWEGPVTGLMKCNINTYFFLVIIRDRKDEIKKNVFGSRNYYTYWLTNDICVVAKQIYCPEDVDHEDIDPRDIAMEIRLIADANALVFEIEPHHLPFLREAGFEEWIKTMGLGYGNLIGFSEIDETEKELEE